ncbi:SDR family NAD(P)-dependent oxidoreductase [Aestuariicella hydrocarbonica]|uniref:SDR family NAD(P)-dependent oxidoreductase n=1 Tax=Pseudomaricurvus hydrocarbonicus TaxID=1470433 RepID=A0A9E5JUA9_9GAMM|nr:SDR family NAD(P)-dependent oxidoreductase [Aestuariicella hydrocarbonica]NHO65728.1 SDR family NAD(P)-dependent oxidoreductase [Aestuariicella hydrocarbonica]
MDFSERYGPWAIIAGASEGTGREFARQVAAQGVNLILIARREAPLMALAEEVSQESGVECVPVSVDLTSADAVPTIIDAAAGREVGLFISNAGSDTNSAQFLDKDMDAWMDLITLNTLSPVQCCHYFAKAMRERKRGGILLVGSGACHGSGPYMSAYSGTKAFNMRFAEGLWAELEPHGVDVLFYALGRTDTPMLRAQLAANGLPLPPGLADPVEVAQVGLERLPHGPAADWGVADDAPGPGGISAAQRRERVRMIAKMSADIFRKETL